MKIDEEDKMRNSKRDKSELNIRNGKENGNGLRNDDESRRKSDVEELFRRRKMVLEVNIRNCIKVGNG